MLKNHALEQVVELRGENLLHARVQRQAVFPVEGGRAGLRKVDKVGKQAETAQLMRIIARSHRGDADHMRCAEAVERIDVGAVVDFAGVIAVQHAMPGHEEKLVPIDRSPEYDGISVRSGDRLLLIGDGERFNVGAANDCKLHEPCPPIGCYCLGKGDDSKYTTARGKRVVPGSKTGRSGAQNEKTMEAMAEVWYDAIKWRVSLCW